MNFVKDAMQVQHNGKSLIDLLHGKLAGYEPGRGFKHIHASALTSDVEFCPREVALLDITKKLPKDRYISVPLRVTFAQGNALHELVRQDWLRDEVVGTWVCRGCDHTINFSKRPKLMCPKCKRNLWKYEEERFTSVTAGVSGGMDMLIDFNTGKHTLVEVKTMDKDQFKSLKAPLAEHRIRTCMYLWIVKDSDRPEREKVHVDKAKLLYISKAFGTKGETGTITPFKEFDVSYNEDTIKSYIAKAQRVHLFRQGKMGVPKGICPTSFVGRVKQCACPQECWSSKYPAQEEVA